MATISNNDIAKAIYFSLKEKSAGEMPKATKEVVRFLSKRKLISKAPQILDTLERISNKAEDRVVASITVAEALKPELKKNITEALTKRYKVKEVKLEESLDQRLIGGFKIRVEDEVIDLSLKKKIKTLSENLIR